MHIPFQEMIHPILLKAKCEIIITIVSKWSKLGMLPKSSWKHTSKLGRDLWGKWVYVWGKGNSFLNKLFSLGQINTFKLNFGKYVDHQVTSLLLQVTIPQLMNLKISATCTISEATNHFSNTLGSIHIYFIRDYELWNVVPQKSNR